MRLIKVLTSAPLPDWRLLLRAVLKTPCSEMFLVKPWSKGGEYFYWFSHSAWSLVAIVNLWQKLFKTNTLNLWLPGYFGNSSLKPLRSTSANLVFYPITDRLEPDYSVCRSISKDTPPDIFLLTHYFGRPANAAKASEFCKHKGAWLVEDAAHVISPIRGVGDHGDFVLYSPHKILPIPDGALLLARSSGHSIDRLEFMATMFQETCNDLVKSVSYKPSFPLLWLVKRILQKCGMRRLKSSKIDFESDNSETVIPHPQMTYMSQNLLSVLVADLPHVRRERRLRMQIWDHVLGETPGLIPVCRMNKDQHTPYLGAFECENESLAKTLFFKFQSIGLPVSTWPDLPPEVIRNAVLHKNSLRIRRHRLYLAVHQTLSIKQVTNIFPDERVLSNESPLSVEWDVTSKDQWNELIDSLGYSNLYQSWAYGQARQTTKCWSVSRAIFRNQQGLIAIVQVLKKTYLGCINVYRINRGPLFINSASIEEKVAVLELVGRLGRWWRARFLVIAPDLESNGQNAVILAQLTYNRFHRHERSSALINLKDDLSVIRQKLDGKWRNMLNAAEKNDLVVEFGNSKRLLNWMLDQYSELIAERGFKGISFSLLRSLCGEFGDHTHLIIFRCVKNDVPVSCICVLKHGTTSTYLIGWNGNQGRSLKAHQFLMWNAIVELKQLGCHWFDLGGIDVDNTPGISGFKLGLNGMRYELIGDYLKF